MTTTPARIDRPVPPSATLAINERIEQRIRDGADVLHLAFGEAQFPLLPSVAEGGTGRSMRAGVVVIAGDPRGGRRAPRRPRRRGGR